MTRLRAEKVAKVADEIPPLEVDHEDGAEAAGARLGIELRRDPGAPCAGVRREQGEKVATAHLRHLNPLPSQHSARCCAPTARCSCPEMNMGQLVKILRAEFLVDADSFTKVEGLPFFADELEAEMLEQDRVDLA